MDNDQNIDMEQYEADNKAIIQQLIDAEDGPCKNASSASQDMIRKRIRENGFSRKILPPKQISNADLNRLPTTELPVIVEDMESDQPGAKSISFNDTPDTQFYRGDKFIIIFNKIVTRTESFLIRFGRRQRGHGFNRCLQCGDVQVGINAVGVLVPVTSEFLSHFFRDPGVCHR